MSDILNSLVGLLADKGCLFPFMYISFFFGALLTYIKRNLTDQPDEKIIGLYSMYSKWWKKFPKKISEKRT